MTESTPPIKSDDYWFEDGDTILSITEDGVETHFRIHRAILTISSPVFRDMFSMPQPPECETLPVPLQDDLLHDVKVLLGFLYRARKLQPQMTFDMILGNLRLSHKYQMTGLQLEMRLKLEKDWPVKFSDFMARISSIGASPEYRVSEAIALIETAQCCQAYELLPAAFYELACAWGTRQEEIIELLSTDNVARLFFGRARSEQRLRAFQKSDNVPYRMWRVTDLTASDPTIFGHRSYFSKCRSTGVRCSDIMFEAFRYTVGSLLFDGIFVIPAIQKCERTDLVKACVYCKDWFMDVLKDRIEELWDQIPTYFNLAEVDSSDPLLQVKNLTS